MFIAAFTILTLIFLIALRRDLANHRKASDALELRLRESEIDKEMSDADLRAAVLSIQREIDREVRVARTRARRSLLGFIMLTVFTAQFLYGMPLNRYFDPWGRLGTLICEAALFLTLLQCTAWAFAVRYQAETEEWVRSLDLPE